MSCHDRESMKTSYFTEITNEAPYRWGRHFHKIIPLFVISEISRGITFFPFIVDKPAFVFTISVYKKNVVIFTSKFIKAYSFCSLDNSSREH